ncbi:MAG: hypothetical protein ABI427_19370 [Solirubrobacteraceae bacterium]
MVTSLEKLIGELTTRYRGLSSAVRRAVWALLGVELVVIAAVERDIARRPAGRLRGPKLLWRVVATQNLIGPVAYLTLGRRRAR